jgi:rhodanese-related sulfurtransferase
MYLAVMTIFAAVLLAVVLVRRTRDRRESERYCITPEALREMLDSQKEVLIVDVRQPLDLLGDSVIIPGAKWFSPADVEANPSLLPKDRDLIVYCTCPSDKTSRIVLRKALAAGFLRIKFLKGGLDGWRSKGYAVEPYTKPFQLNSGGNAHPVAAS